jgi:hypothetical protein
VVEREELIDEKHDILSHQGRRNTLHILSIDPVLTVDVYKRIRNDERLSHYRIKRPRAKTLDERIDQLQAMAQDTTKARLLIYDVRRATLPKLRRVFRDITGFNRKDFNKLCYTILIGDGPPTLFQNGRGLDVFTIYLGGHRVDYHPAVFFYDPLLHYEPDEMELRAIDDEFVLRDDIPQRLIPYFQNSDEATVGAVRRFFRAVDKDEETRTKRKKVLKNLYKKRFAEQFPGRETQLKAWMSYDGLQLATEKLNLYPLFFEDWVHNLMTKAQENAAPPAKKAEPEAREQKAEDGEQRAESGPG